MLGCCVTCQWMDVCTAELVLAAAVRSQPAASSCAVVDTVPPAPPARSVHLDPAAKLCASPLACSDGISMGTDGMSFSLQSRDIIAGARL